MGLMPGSRSQCLHLLLRYSPQMIDLEHKLKPFIPDFIPAVGDIDAFLKVQHLDFGYTSAAFAQKSPIFSM